MTHLSIVVISSCRMSCGAEDSSNMAWKSSGKTARNSLVQNSYYDITDSSRSTLKSSEKGNAWLPACSWFCHGDCANAFSSNHLRNEFLDLGITAIVTDVRHHNVRVEGESRPWTVGVHPKKGKWENKLKDTIQIWTLVIFKPQPFCSSSPMYRGKKNMTGRYVALKWMRHVWKLVFITFLTEWQPLGWHYLH